MSKKILGITIGVILVMILGLLKLNKNEDLPIVAIANYGPHTSLEAAIQGFKDELSKNGFIDNKNIKYEIADVGFDGSLIPQMISKLKSSNPKVIMVMTTPVAQFAKGVIKDIPLIYNVITDPVEAGLIKNPTQADGNMTGSSEKQDLKLVLEFAKKLLPNAKRIGLLYSTAESNDASLVKMMIQAAHAENMELVAIPIDQARDVPIRMQGFKDKVDLIYVGTSGPIQPTLPVISSEATKMKIPVFNADEASVKDNTVFASFGVDYHKVGANAGKIASQILQGQNTDTLIPLYPSSTDHNGFISAKKADELGISIPSNLSEVQIIK